MSAMFLLCLDSFLPFLSEKLHWRQQQRHGTKKFPHAVSQLNQTKHETPQSERGAGEGVAEEKKGKLFSVVFELCGVYSWQVGGEMKRALCSAAN